MRRSLLGDGKQGWLKSEILRVLANDGPLSKRQVHIRVSRERKGYPERVPRSTFRYCTDALVKMGLVKEETQVREKERRVDVNLRLTINGFCYVIYRMLSGKQFGDLENVFHNFYSFLARLHAMLRMDFDRKKTYERANRYLEFRPVEKLFFLMAVKTLEFSPSRPPSYAKIMMEHLSTGLMEEYVNSYGLQGRAPEDVDVYKRFLRSIEEAVGEYLLSEKDEDFSLCLKAFNEAYRSLKDLERKMVLQHLKNVVELKLYSISPALTEEKSLELKNKMEKVNPQETVLPYHCPNCGNEGFALVNLEKFSESLSVICERCRENTNRITFGKVKIAEPF